MSAFTAIATRAVVWSLLLIFGIGLPFGIIAGIGAVFGAILGIHCMGRSLTLGKARNIPAVMIPGILILCMLVASDLLYGLFPSGLTGVVLSNVLKGAFFGAVFVPSAMTVSRLLGTNIPEALVAALVGSIPFLDASGGHFERPRWFADYAISRGHDPAHLLTWAGGGLILFSVFGLLSIPLPENAKRPRPSGLLFLILLAGGVTFLISTQLPPVPASPHQPPRPPMSFSGTPPPPPPPEPNPLAAVQFSDIPRSSPRLKGFYFRKPDPECSTNAMPSGGRVTEMTIWYLKEGVGPLVNPGESLEMSVPSEFDRAKSASWSATRMPSISNHDDFIVHSGDEPEEVATAIASLSLRTNPPLAAPPEIQKFLASMDRIIAGKQSPPEIGLLGTLTRGGEGERVTASPSLQAVLVTDWIGSNGTLDEKFTNGSSSPDEFVKTGLKGTSRQFSELAVACLKARGINARLAEGYFVAAESQPDDRILITDSCKDAWPEVQTVSGIWLPLPVHPMKVSSNDKSRGQEDRKKEIFDAIRKKKSAEPPGSRANQSKASASSWKTRVAPLVGFFVAASLLLWLLKRVVEPLYLIRRAPVTERAHALFHTLAMISVRRYGARGFGETWEHYAITVIGPVNPHRAEILLDASSRVPFTLSSSLAELPSTKTFLLFLLAGFLPRFVRFRHHVVQLYTPTNQ